MLSRWSDAEAEAFVAEQMAAGVGRDLALRLYSARLLGSEPRLVLHGGGNVSLKTTARDFFDEAVGVLCVKASGFDLQALTAAGLPAVRLEPLLRLQRRAALSDEDMVRSLRANLLDPGAPDLSVETLLHAFLPHRYIDHTHAVAVLSLSDQPDGAARIADLYGGRVGIVPYLRPGFPLACKAAEVFAAGPAVEGLVLSKHGIFTFGDTAAEAYQRMIALVDLAERALACERKAVFAPRRLPSAVAEAADVAPILRGACALPDPHRSGAWRRLVLDYRSGDAVRAYVDGAELERYARAGVATPDHVIRTKPWPLIVPPPEAGALDAFKAAARTAAERFIVDYRAYFARHSNGTQIPLDPAPRVILVPGLGLYGLGRSAAEARIAADIAVSAIDTVTGAEAVGRFQSLDEAEMFAVEYWSLEQKKLGRAAERPLQGQVAIVTGGGGAIGRATARAFNGAGAEIALFDIDAAAVEAAVAELGGHALGVACDVTSPVSVHAAFARVVGAFGGLDIVVSNAGAAWQGRIGEVADAVLRQSFELNFFAHQTVAQNAVRIMLAQGTGGCLLFNVSKQAVNPGPNFGPYGLPKAATLFLVRQYALDYGGDGIRANAVNADRIRSGLLTPEMIAARATARGQSEADYMAGNLLRREVTAEDVAEAFLHQALELATTADVTTVDGGNIAAALR
jgi:rhamnose utilization protein RhaD (predicted bifunctional aldolase and dehydrogenase)/NAD(P)-dependent dehydrogenase (short-subunit alcohol dehydrogenase family)